MLIRYWDAGAAGYSESLRELLAWSPWPPPLVWTVVVAAAALGLTLIVWATVTAWRSARP